MTELFAKASNWLSELSINNKAFPACLKIEKACLVNLNIGKDELLVNLREVVGTKAIYWGVDRPESEWLFLESL